MMNTQMLTPELSSNPARVRARLCGPSLALCLLGAVACSGTIDENQDTPRLVPAPNATNNGSNAAAPRPAGGPTGTNTSDEASANEREDDDIRGVSGSSSSAGSRRGGAGRARTPQLRPDAGVIEDAGVLEPDAAVLDAGPEVIEEDAGLAGDAAP